MRKFMVIPVVVLLLCLSLWPASADVQPFREREVLNQDFTTAADILTSSLTTGKRGSVTLARDPGACTFRVTFAIDAGGTASVLNLRVTRQTPDAGYVQNYALNDGTAIQPGRIFAFDFQATSSCTYNFRVGTNTKIGLLQVERLDREGGS